MILSFFDCLWHFDEMVDTIHFNMIIKMKNCFIITPNENGSLHLQRMGERYEGKKCNDSNFSHSRCIYSLFAAFVNNAQTIFDCTILQSDKSFPISILMDNFNSPTKNRLLFFVICSSIRKMNEMHFDENKRHWFNKRIASNKWK